MSEEFDTDLLIVGAGPVGLTASIIASELGIDHWVIERREGLHALPQAHVIKTRTMEVFRRLGFEQQVHDLGTPVEGQRYTVWCESLCGNEYGRIDLAGKKGPSERFLSVSPTYPANLSQDLLEPVIFEKARALAPENTIRFRTALKGFQQDADGVTAEIEDADGSLRTVRARYMIGADGAGSFVRRTLDITFEGPTVLTHFCSVHLRSDLTALTADRPGVLYWVLNPDVKGTFIVHDASSRQVFMIPYRPGEREQEDFTLDYCRDKVARAIGGDHDFDISQIDFWTMSAQVATQYRDGRVFLVGDAAHRFPPTGGLGMNTGIQDVNNLLWKLGAVLRGQAPSSLLDTYGEESLPIARRNRDRSADNFRSMAKVEQLLGVNPDPAVFAASLQALFADRTSDTWAAIQDAIDEQVRHFAYMDVEMAPVYASGAFGASVDAGNNGLPVVEGYAPGITPGGGLPHVPCADGRSTLDALAYDRLTLFVGEEHAGVWQAAIDRKAGDLPLPVRIHPIDATTQAGWARVCGRVDVAVLARPDGHVGWVCPARPEAPEEELDRMSDAVLGRSAAAQSRVAS